MLGMCWACRIEGLAILRLAAARIVLQKGDSSSGSVSPDSMAARERCLPRAPLVAASAVAASSFAAAGAPPPSMSALEEELSESYQRAIWTVLWHSYHIAIGELSAIRELSGQSYGS